jgi:hypothetical protein
VRLDVAGRRAFRAALHDVTQDREAHRVTEGGELFGVALELRGHDQLLTFSK